MLEPGRRVPEDAPDFALVVMFARILTKSCVGRCGAVRSSRAFGSTMWPRQASPSWKFRVEREPHWRQIVQEPMVSS